MKFKNVVLSRFSADNYIPCPSGYTRGQGWNCLFRAWLGYKIANNPRNGETIQDKLFWAQMIQNIQTDLGLPRASFPQLGLLGDHVWMYDAVKQQELEDLEFDLKIEEWKKEQKKERKAYFKDIVSASMLTEQEIEWLKDDFQGAAVVNENGFVERIYMANAFDMKMRRNYHL